MYCLGLDIGTTTVCAVVIDSVSGDVLRSVTLPNDAAIEGADYEKLQSPMLILRKCTKLVDTLADAFSPLGCIGVTGQMHGILYYDRAGNAVSPLYTWQDGSGRELAADGEPYAAALSRITGYPTASGFGACTAYVHRVRSRIPKSAVGFCTIHDYVAMHLAGQTRPLCHVSDAASFGLFDLKTGVFDETAIRKAELDGSLFPNVTADFAVLGTYRGATPVCCAVGDNQASFLGSVSDMENSILVNLGTGGQVSYLTDRPADRALEVRPLGEGKYIAVGASLCGGSAFSALESFLRQTAELVTGQPVASAYPAIDRYLADTPEPKNALLVDTRFCGTRQDAALRAGIQNLDLQNFTPRHLIWGVMQGIVTELLEMYLAGDHGKMQTLVCSGNGLRKNPALKKQFARRFGMNAVTPVHTEEAAFGAALCGMTACGEADSIADAQTRIRYETDVMEIGG